MDITANFKKILFILAIAIGSHIIVFVVKFLHRRIVKKKQEVKNTKWLSISSLIVSILVFVIYFVAVGKILIELGVSLSTYIASASIIGLAVAFGSQGIVQDVVTGVTVVFSDLLDIGDLVEIAGQTGYVESIGMRFIIIKNVNKAKVFIPNRTVNNVINYSHGNIRFYFDVRMPEDINHKKIIGEIIKKMVDTFEEQYPSFFIDKTTVEEVSASTKVEILRIVFKMWPNRYSIVETNFKQELFTRIQAIDTTYSEWMISLASEIE
jgi:small-conductance mechanosensitive channel